MIAARTFLLLTALALLQAGAWAEPRESAAVARGRAAVEAAPESAAAYFALGGALYRAEAFEEAAGTYQTALALIEPGPARGAVLHNLGNCLARAAARDQTERPAAALAECDQAAWFFRAALEADPTLRDAAFNLEMTHRLAALARGEQEKQEKQEREQNELIAHIRERLQEFIERQTALIEAAETGAPQAALRGETTALAREMEASGLTQEIEAPGGARAPGPLRETWQHTLKAAEAMAAPDQPTALAELNAALGAAPEDPNQQGDESEGDAEGDEEYDMEYEQGDEDAEMYEEADPFGDFSEYEEIRGVPPPNRSEMDILAEEARNQERRARKKAAEYKQVEKDW